MIKNFIINGYDCCYAVWNDNSEYENFVNSRIQVFNDLGFFCNKETTRNKTEFLHLIKDVLLKIEEDKTNTGIVNNSQNYDLNCYKDELIYYFNLCLFIGRIILETFDSPKNEMKSGENNGKQSINLFAMFKEAYDTMKKAKVNNDSSVYGSTLILTALIEFSLKQDTKIAFLKQCLLKLKAIPVTDQNELKLIGFLENAANSISDDSFDFFKGTTTDAFNLFRKYGLFNEEGEKKLVNNEITLNQLIKLNFFIKNIDGSDRVNGDFLNMMKYTFEIDKLNLRNQMAHGNVKRINYYSIAMCSYLLFLHIVIHNKYYLN